MGVLVVFREGPCSEKMTAKAPLHVLISGAAGQIGYSIIPLVASGLALGPDQPVVLHLLDITPAMKALSGVVMEIEDGAYPLVQDVIATDNYDEAFKGVDYCILVGGFPRKKGMLRADLLAKNAGIFKATGEALEKHAKRSVKVIVVANPANTNCLTCATHAPSIPKENFCALTRLDMNRARAQLTKKLGLPSSDMIRNVVIWGNHSKTMVPDINSATLCPRVGCFRSTNRSPMRSGLRASSRPQSSSGARPSSGPVV